MDITNLNKSEVLVKLYNNAKPQGMGYFQADNKDMTIEEAEKILKEGGSDLYFDYLEGRVMKIDLSTNELNTGLYNRDNGEGAAEAALKDLKKHD